MAYTEIKERNGKKYFYRVISVRNGKKVSKKRKYLGLNLQKEMLFQKEQEADKNLIINKKRKLFLDKIKPKIIKILKKNKIKKAGIFGSYARGEQKKNSDIDILIEPPKGMGFGFAGLQIELSEELNKKVDLVTYKGISPYLKNRILKQEIRII
ncbi:MAG: nucleotidyltransferase family protein [Nanoarchaeota archaeon]